MKYEARFIFSLIAFLIFGSASMAQQMVTVPDSVVSYPAMIVHNAKIVTMDDTSFGLNTPIGNIFQAMAVRDGNIMALGTDAEILAMAGPETDQIDVNGRMVMPGIVDTHTHIHNNELNSWIRKNPQVVSDVASSYAVSGTTDEELSEAVSATIREHTRATDRNRWAFISVGRGGGTGTGAGVSFLANKKYTMAMMDRIAPNHPIILQSHPSYVINSAGIEDIKRLYGAFFSMEAAGIDEAGRVRATAPQYGRGLIIDGYFNARVPELADIVEAGLLKNAAVGITTYSSHIMGQRFLDAFNYLARRDRMPIRFGYTHWFGFAAGYSDPALFYKRVGDMAMMGTDFFWHAGVGLGSIDSGPPRFCSTMEASRTIKEMEWCQNAQGSSMYEATRTAIANYQRVLVGHAYADKGVNYFMDAVEAAMEDNPGITLDHIHSIRLSSDHCGFYPSVEQLPRMAKLGMMISCGSAAMTRSYPWIGEDRYPAIYMKRIAPIKTAILAGVMPTYEDESGVSEGVARSYFHSSKAFLTRKNDRGQDVNPDEAIDRNTLMKMMTSWAARFMMKEEVLGTLETGKYADFLVLNGDYFSVPLDDVSDIHPLMTVVNGKIRVLKEEFAGELGREAVGPQITFDNSPRYGAAD
jgi:predicted amidohydrolase YtcJ